jgi:2-keto-myo-inositol isomerase
MGVSAGGFYNWAMNLCLSQACTLSASFAEDVIGYADGGCPHAEVWLTKLEKHLETSSVGATKDLLADRGAALVAAAYQGGLLLSQGEQRAAAFDHYKRRLELCQQFGVRTLLVVADFATRIDETSLGRAVVSLTQAAQWAAAFDVRLGLEFRGTDAFCSCLETALLLVEQCGEPNVGVCLDAFHYYKGPSKPEDLERLTPANLAHVQLCDVPGVPREVMTDGDRVFPGEGDFRLSPIVETLRRIGYDGWVSLELMNPMVWSSKPSQVAELGMTALRRTVK